MGYSIDFNGKDLSFFCKSGELKVELIDLNRNKAMISWSFFSGGSNSFDLVDLNVDRIHLTYNNTDLRIINVINGKLEELNGINPDFSLPFICITGHHGGGTSVVAKSLKHLGINIGADSGGFEQRKTFESVAMRTFIDRILINKKSKIRTSFGKALESYKYDKDNINAFKITDLEDKKGSSNGIGLSKIFKDIKFVSVVKKSKGTGKTPEGKLFNHTQDIDIYRNQHPKVQAPIFHLDWNRYFTDYNYVNELLEFIGSDISINAGDFEEMLDAIKFEKGLLK